MPPPFNLIILHPVGASESSNEQELVNDFDRLDGIRTLTIVLEDETLKDLVKDVEVIPIGLLDFKDKLQGVNISESLLINLCDGTEADGYPGISVVKYLEERKFNFTGARQEFYRITTSKPILKECITIAMLIKLLINANVPTALFVVVDEHNIPASIEKALSQDSFPLIVKPSVSYASISITKSSIVSDFQSAVHQVEVVLKTTKDGVFLESFLAGREFTALVTGDARSEESIKVYTVAERVFNEKLEDKERILAFDKYWEGYDLQGGNGNGQLPFYWYERAPAEWEKQLSKISKEAYIACKGSGYGRVDIRTKNRTELEAFVLEVNANCGLTFEEHSSSLAEILSIDAISPTNFMREILLNALKS